MMRNIITIITVLMLFSCDNIYTNRKIVGTLSNNLFLQEMRDPSKTTSKILYKFLPSILACAKADTSDFFYGDSVIEDDSLTRLLFVGKKVNNTTILATEINLKDTVVKFYLLENDSWKIIGSEKINIPFYRIQFEDLDGDGRNEIITSTFFNMNGNCWNEIYYFSDKAKTVKYAGSFSTTYVVQKDKKQIEETYEGSWYMDKSKTLYEWRQEMLVPVRQVILAHDQPVSENGKLTYEYYENSTNKIDGLKLKYKEPYRENNKRQEHLWDNFFN